MKIATFNANSIRARAAHVIDWLDQNKPEVLCVQETKVQDSEFPVDAFADTGYGVVYQGMKAYNGIAVFSRVKPEFVSFGLKDGKEPDEPRLGHVVVEGLPIITTYVPQGYLIDSPKYPYKLEWFKRLRRYFETHLDPAKPAVWLGDMNVAPEPIDVHHPDDHEDHVCFHIDARNAYAEVKAWGFEDLFRKLYPDRQQFTFWDYRFRAGKKSALEANLGWRIDHILATRPLAEKLQRIEVDVEARKKLKASDHTFVWAEFDW